MELLACPCGGKPAIDWNVRSDTLKAVSAEYADKKTKFEKELKPILTIAAQQPHLMELARMEERVRALMQPGMGVYCDKCSSGITDRDKLPPPPGTEITPEQQAEKNVSSLWNRAVEKFGSLKECCKKAENLDHKVDVYGMPIKSCKECGVRHYQFG